MLVDDIQVQLEAGHGGKGSVAFNKIRLNRGPTGADGGRGADIYFEGVRDINALTLYVSRKVIKSENGKDGRGQFVDGRNGHDLYLKVPIGTRITNLSTGTVREINEVGEKFLAAGGGKGGRGNFKFRSSTNTSPKEFEEGTMGDVIPYRLEVRLIADVGLIGLPNAGKSSLLNELTGAHSKVANYPFTTLEPSLGAYYELILADIPGLIEGASQGKGLGVKFLKHIERTRTLFHLVSAESDDPVRDYKIVRKELEEYSPTLAKKEERVFLSKTDMNSDEELEVKVKAMKKAKIKIEPLSLLDPKSLTRIKEILNTIKDSQ